MSELTDLEICEKIAKIRYGKAYVDSDETGNFININHPMSDRGGEVFNPLTDDALIFNLAFENKVKIDYFDECVYISFKRKVFWFNFDKDDINSLRRSISLAIIESHKGK